MNIYELSPRLPTITFKSPLFLSVPSINSILGHMEWDLKPYLLIFPKLRIERLIYMIEMRKGLPVKQGMYDPQFEKDACGMGFVAHIKGRKSHEIVEQALTLLFNMEHRGGQGSEPNTGDGAGILLQIPHRFFSAETAKIGFELPEPGQYAVAMVFLPQDESARRNHEEIFEGIISEEGQTLLGWRTVPTNDESWANPRRKLSLSFAKRSSHARLRWQDDMAFERKLYVIRKRAEHAIRYSGMEGADIVLLSRASRARRSFTKAC